MMYDLGKSSLFFKINYYTVKETRKISDLFRHVPISVVRRDVQLGIVKGRFVKSKTWVY